MKIQKFLHSCLLVEENGTRILFDPGLYSFIEGKVKPEEFKRIDAVLITHNHFDHVDADSLKIILKNNPKASVYGNQDTAEMLKKSNVIVLPFNEGKKKIGAIEVEAIYSRHATILSATPKNTAYIVSGRLLITGDSFDEGLEQLKGIQILALPITAPWLRSVDAIAFAEDIGAKTIIPVHDGFVKDFFLERQLPFFAKSIAAIGANFHPLKLGEILEI